MNKCEWKEIDFRDQRYDWEAEFSSPGILAKLKYREKPEPEVIIKKSGETWVKREDDVDYLFIGKPVQRLDEVIFYSRGKSSLWKPISEIEITDEIAKLRPMVVSEDEPPEMLYGVAPVRTAVTSGGINPLNCYCLATVSDLEGKC